MLGIEGMLGIDGMLGIEGMLGILGVLHAPKPKAADKKTAQMRREYKTLLDRLIFISLNHT